MPTSVMQNHEIGKTSPSTRRTMTPAEWDEFESAHARLQEQMAAAGVTEDEIVEDFRQLRRAEYLKLTQETGTP